jgi:hypothetical protein
MSRRFNHTAAALIAMTAAGIVAMHGADAEARLPRKQLRGRLATILRAEAPLGVIRKNAAVIIPFSLQNNRRKAATIEIQYGWDQDGDGTIATGLDPLLPSEYISASQNREDTRDTSKRSNPLKYRAGIPPGIAHAYSWNANLDLAGLRLDPAGKIVTTPQGRPVVDPNSPEDLLRQDGESGVSIRIRSTAGKGRRKVASDWVYTRDFALNNNSVPALTLDDVAEGPITTFAWTAFDADSEDANGDGLFDLLREDRDGDGIMDASTMSVAFDYYRLAEDEDVSRLSDAELDALLWLPCTRVEDAGDSDVDAPSSPVGTQNVFAWDWQADPSITGDRVVIRARGYDGQEHTTMMHWLAPITLVN